LESTTQLIISRLPTDGEAAPFDFWAIAGKACAFVSDALAHAQVMAKNAPKMRSAGGLSTIAISSKRRQRIQTPSCELNVKFATGGVRGLRMLGISSNQLSLAQAFQVILASHDTPAT
jgi:hypothetical protein